MLLTLDTDWAPDFMIRECAEILADKGVRATWFVTHDSPEIRRLASHRLFELGIHPNFHRGSSHGRTPDQVVRHCLKIVPKARLMRTHDLFQSTSLLFRIAEISSVRADFSVLLPRAPSIRPVKYPNGLIRVPYFFDDSLELMSTRPDWSISSMGLRRPGLKVFNFHPVHVYCNSPDFATYAREKKAIYAPGATPEKVGASPASKAGPRSLFLSLVSQLAASGGGRKAGALLRSFS